MEFDLNVYYKRREANEGGKKVFHSYLNAYTRSCIHIVTGAIEKEANMQNIRHCVYEIFGLHCLNPVPGSCPG